ncbi:hypothetical protein [Leptospira santarosai]|uniref:hypothetical protein n=1 Tax=Leptospira santarosai TaxID=28183 RepID=UPI0026E2E797|nr:hypothetical protein [Leptospira santarosai]MDO6383382.1 hypothetical protein [Leptospira santarosai]
MSAKIQPTKRLNSIMSPDEWREWIKAELAKKGKNLMSIKTKTGLSYSTVRDTLSGRTANPAVLAYLAELGIAHGRIPGIAKPRKAG